MTVFADTSGLFAALVRNDTNHDADLYSRAVRRLALRCRRRVSLVDCLSFVAMEESGIQTAFSFDRHFKDEGFTLV